MTRVRLKVLIEILPTTDAEGKLGAWILDGLDASGLLFKTRGETLDESLLADLKKLMEELCQLFDRAKARLATGGKQ